ncbi:MAG: alpha/beta hydrolase [Cyanobacteria bacterium P01_F01_bin.150]
MNHQYDALWLSVSPQLQRFDQRLSQRLIKATTVRQWNYRQTADEPCCLETCLILLHDYLKQHSRPIHILGHGMSGIVGLLYARRHPERVASLTLLSVGANPTVSWHSHYYALRNLLPCKRSMVLVQVARLLCGPYCPSVLKTVAGMLEKDLDECLALHSLASRTAIQPDSIKPPLLVCQGKLDVILDPNTQLRWDQYLKDGDRFWQCPEGRHFFHYEYPQMVADEIIAYWETVFEYAPLMAQAA